MLQTTKTRAETAAPEGPGRRNIKRPEMEQERTRETTVKTAMKGASPKPGTEAKRPKQIADAEAGTARENGTGRLERFPRREKPMDAIPNPKEIKEVATNP